MLVIKIKVEKTAWALFFVIFLTVKNKAADVIIVPRTPGILALNSFIVLKV